MSRLKASLRRIQPVRSLWHRWKSFRDQRIYEKLASSFSNIDDFMRYAEKVGHHNLLQYHRGNADERRRIFQSLFTTLDISLKGASFLDLGPGYGDSLDLAREDGATCVEFVDYDPYAVVFNTLKGYKGHRFDYVVGKGLTPLFPNKYDVILSKGSINADAFNRKEPGMILFPTWLAQVENLASARGQIIICPTFDRGERMSGASYHVCRDPEAFRQSWFTQILLENGYKTLFIDGFNETERFPFTFYKKLG